MIVKSLIIPFDIYGRDYGLSDSPESRYETFNISEEQGKKFSDVNEAAWFADEVNAAVEAGLINGYMDGTFRPAVNLTREQMAALISHAYTYLEKNESNIDENQILAKFKDESFIGDWARKHVALAVQLGVIQGTQGNEIQPKEHASRAETAAMLKRFFVKVEILKDNK